MYTQFLLLTNYPYPLGTRIWGCRAKGSVICTIICFSSFPFCWRSAAPEVPFSSLHFIAGLVLEHLSPCTSWVPQLKPFPLNLNCLEIPQPCRCEVFLHQLHCQFIHSLALFPGDGKSWSGFVCFLLWLNTWVCRNTLDIHILGRWSWTGN